MSNIDNHIRERLDGFYETNYANVPDCFVYQFGPYISMVEGYEKDADALARHNSVMKTTQSAAYIIRGTLRALANPDRKPAREFLRSALLDVDREFPMDTYPAERAALLKLIEKYLAKTVAKTTESVVTDIAPVVPYQEELRKPDIIAQETKFGEHVRYFMEVNGDVRMQLHKLLLENLDDIMSWHMVMDFSPDVLRNLHNFTTRIAQDENDPGYANPELYRYALLAALYYHNPNHELLDGVVKFYDHLLHPNVDEDYATFEAFIDEIVNSNFPVLESAWEDIDLEEKDENAVNRMLDGVSYRLRRDESPDYDLTALLNFIAVNRYMQFDVFCNRKFIEDFKIDTDTVDSVPSRIININRLGPNKNGYELNKGIIVVPYVDLRDYQVRYIHLKKGDSSPYISGKIHDY